MGGGLTAEQQVQVAAQLDAEHQTLVRAMNEARQHQYFVNIPKIMQAQANTCIAVPSSGAAEGEESELVQESLLKLAIRYKKVEMVRDLLRCGADIYLPSGTDLLTPVHELNAQLHDDYQSHAINDLRLAMIADSMSSQADFMTMLPYYSTAAIVAPVLLVLFIATGQHHYLSYYAAIGFATAKIIKDNAPILGAGFRTLLYGKGTYSNFFKVFEQNADKPDIIKPSSFEKRHARQLYDTIRLSLYLCSYTALACGSFPLYAAMFTLAIAACSVRQMVKLFQCLNHPKIRRGYAEQQGGELLAKYHHQEAIIEKTFVKMIERGVYTILVGAWFISPMNVTTLCVLSTIGLLTYAAKLMTCSIIQSYRYDEFKKSAEDTEATLSTSYADTSTLPDSTMQGSLAACYQGVTGNVGLFIQGYVHREGVQQTFTDVYRLIDESVTAYLAQANKQVAALLDSTADTFGIDFSDPNLLISTLK